jgi:DNA polymerase III delta subunit
MAINFEGNLSAGYQVLYNLYLQGITGNVSYEDLKKQTVAENHFTSDDFTAALAEKNSAKALRIIQNVREERVALKSFLWAVHRDLAVIVELKHPDHRGDFEIFKKYSVLIKFHQERLLKMAASIASAKHLNNLVKLFTRIDASVIREDYAWELLETYAVGFNNPAFLNGFIKNV